MEGGIEDDDDDEVPDLVENFDEPSKNEAATTDAIADITEATNAVVDITETTEPEAVEAAPVEAAPVEPLMSRHIHQIKAGPSLVTPGLSVLHHGCVGFHWFTRNQLPQEHCLATIARSTDEYI